MKMIEDKQDCESIHNNCVCGMSQTSKTENQTDHIFEGWGSFPFLSALKMKLAGLELQEAKGELYCKLAGWLMPLKSCKSGQGDYQYFKLQTSEVGLQMKQLTLLTVAFAFALFGLAMAGDYHSGASLNCNECHVMHYSQTHGYNDDGGGITVPLGTTGPYHYLLRNEINALCLTCHDGQVFAPDVLATGTNAPANGRLAGGLNRDNTAPYYDNTGHTLNATDVATGGTWSNPDGLNCVNCHTQHGRGGSWGGVTYSLYRNANIFVNGAAPTTPLMTYAIGTNDLTRDIFERSATFGGNHYDLNNVDFNEPDPTQSGYGRYCGQCHTNFHGAVGSAAVGGVGTPPVEFGRHPVAGVNIGGVGGGHSSLTRKYDDMAYRLKVMSPTGNWGTYGTAFGGTPTVSNAPADHTPSCMTCHKAHGTTRSFGLIWATGAAPIGENGDGTRYDQQCGQCHVQVNF